MAVNFWPLGLGQLELGDGLPAVGGKLFFYVAGSVNTKQNTYTDYTGLVANTNPVILNSLGMPTNTQIWFTAGQRYKIVYAPSTDTDPPTSPIKTWDYLAGVNDAIASVDQWVASAFAPTYVSATSFTLPGDQTNTFQIGRRIQTTNSGGTIYSMITNSVFGALTTVTVVNDSGVLDAGLSAVSYGILSSQNSSLPITPSLQNSAYQLIGTIAGTNTITGVLTPTLTAYKAGQTFRFNPANTNTGATTLSIDGLSARNVFLGNAALTGGEIQAAVPIEVMYDGVAFQVIGPFMIPRSTWTPALTINTSAVGITYTRQTGRYVKVGPLVFVSGNIILSNKGASVGNVALTGLPFTSVTTASTAPEDGLAVDYHLNVSTTGGQSMNFVVNSATTVASLFLLSDTSTINVADTNIANNTQIIFSGCYQAAA